jgi:cytochrome oxidase Cu insertion factor (SCO1/SenC/PrrC family)
MLQRLNVDTLEFAYADLGRTYGRASNTCDHCAAAAKCVKWLRAAGNADEEPAFCPQLDVFRRFARPQHAEPAAIVLYAFRLVGADNRLAISCDILGADLPDMGARWIYAGARELSPDRDVDVIVAHATIVALIQADGHFIIRGDTGLNKDLRALSGLDNSQ